MLHLCCRNNFLSISVNFLIPPPFLSVFSALLAYIQVTIQTVNTFLLTCAQRFADSDLHCLMFLDVKVINSNNSLLASQIIKLVCKLNALSSPGWVVNIQNKTWSLVSNSSLDFGGGCCSCCCCSSSCDRGKLLVLGLGLEFDNILVTVIVQLGLGFS